MPDSRYLPSGRTPEEVIAHQVARQSRQLDDLRSRVTARQPRFHPYTPAWTATVTNPSLGNGTLAGEVTRDGELVTFQIFLTMGSTTTYGGGAWLFSLPVAADAPIATIVGNSACRDVSASTWRPRPAVLFTASTFFLAGDGSFQVTSASPFTWATGDTLGIFGTYKPAA